MTTQTLATATKGSEVRIPEFYEDGSPTNAGDTWGKLVSIVARGWARVEWGGSLVNGIFVPQFSHWYISELEARCVCCKRPLDGDHAHNGIYHGSCGRESDRQERAEARRYQADIEATDRAFPRSPGSYAGMQPRRHSYDPDAERGDYP